MFVVFSTLLVLIVSKALSYRDNSKVCPIEQTTLKTYCMKSKDLSKENLSLEKINYYEQLWNEK